VEQEEAVQGLQGRMEKPEMPPETAVEGQAVVQAQEVFMAVEVPVLQVQ
jgi:hypothetical protein